MTSLNEAALRYFWTCGKTTKAMKCLSAQMKRPDGSL